MSENRIKIVHLSDPHFGTTDLDKQKALREIISELSPNLVIVSGDITQRARASEFREARQFFKTLAPVPVHIVPGNHDIPLMNVFGRLFWPHYGFQHVLKKPLSWNISEGFVQVIGLNSTSRFRHIQGKFGRQEVQELAQISERTSFRIAVFHQPLACAKAVDQKNLLRGESTAIEALYKNKIDLTLSGHVHDPFVTLSSDRYGENPDACILTVAGTCLSSRTRSGAPNSFNVIEASVSPSLSPSPTAENDERAKTILLNIDRYDYSVGKNFLPVLSTSFRRDGGRWQELGPKF